MNTVKANQPCLTSELAAMLDYIELGLKPGGGLQSLMIGSAPQPCKKYVAEVNSEIIQNRITLLVHLFFNTKQDSA